MAVISSSSSLLFLPSSHSGAPLSRFHLPFLPPPSSSRRPLTAADPPSRLTARALEDGYGDRKAKSSGTTARERRMIRVKEGRIKREKLQERRNAKAVKILVEASKTSSNLRSILGDSIGNLELMQQKLMDYWAADETESSVPEPVFNVSFRDFDPFDSFIWFELLAAPSDEDVNLLGGVIQSWYIMGRLGAFNSSNLQLADSTENSSPINDDDDDEDNDDVDSLTDDKLLQDDDLDSVLNSSADYNPVYDDEKASAVLPASFHDVSDVEFQDNWCRVRVDLGTCDYFALDVLLNCVTNLNSEYLRIKQVVFGGRGLGDWEEGMTRPEDGYRSFQI